MLIKIKLGFQNKNIIVLFEKVDKSEKIEVLKISFLIVFELFCYSISFLCNFLIKSIKPTVTVIANV